MVFDWLKRKQAGLRNPLDLPDEVVRLLTSEFGQLKKVGRDLPDRCLRFVVDGDGEDVLADLRRRRDCSEALGFVHHPGGSYYWVESSDYRRQLYRKVRNEHQEMFVRLAMVHSAASTGLDRLPLGAETPAWLDGFLSECWDSMRHHIAGAIQTVSAETVERMLVATGESQDLLVRVAFLTEMRGRWQGSPTSYASPIGFAESLLRHREPVVEALCHRHYEQRVNALHLLDQLSAPMEPFVDLVVDLSVSPSERVRDAARPLMARNRALVSTLLQEKATSGKPDERVHAVKLLHHLCGDEARAFLESRRSEESSQKVLDEIAGLLDVQVPDSVPLREFPPISCIDPPGPLPDTVLSQFRAMLEEYNEWWASQDARRGRWLGKAPVRAACDALVAPARDLVRNDSCRVKGIRWAYPESLKHLTQIVADPALTVPHLFRLGWVLDELPFDVAQANLSVESRFDALVKRFNATHRVKASLRDLAAFVAAMGGSTDLVGRAMLVNYCPILMWGDDLVWPYFAEHLHLLERVLEPWSEASGIPLYRDREVRMRAYRVLSMFPQIPPSLVPGL